MNEITTHHSNQIYKIFGDMPMLSHKTLFFHQIFNDKCITSSEKNKKKNYSDGVVSRFLPYVYFSPMNYEYVKYCNYEVYHYDIYATTIIFPVDILKNKEFFHSIKWRVYPEYNSIHYKTIEPIREYINGTLQNIDAKDKKQFNIYNEILVKDDIPLKNAIMIVMSKYRHIKNIKKDQKYYLKQIQQKKEMEKSKQYLKYIDMAMKAELELIAFCDTHKIIRVYV